MTDQPTLRFSCTVCGACCNRNPEVALSEAAALADVFIFRLMFRIYQTPLTPRALDGAAEKGAFFEGKRLMETFSAKRWESRHRAGTKAGKLANYLMLSALPLDVPSGACAALESRRCGIYERRPVACRTVPLHYSRPASAAPRALATFVARQGYQCATGDEVDLLFANGRIVNEEVLSARAEASRLAEKDKRWSRAIVSRMMGNMTEESSLPTLRQVEENAQFGVTTVSMRVAWQIAVDEGLISLDRLRALIERQLALIEQEIVRRRCVDDERQTLHEMRSEYREALDPCAPVAAFLSKNA